MLKINLEKIAPKLAKVRKTPNKTLSRTHYINFLREEDKFVKATEKMEESMDNWSLKTPFHILTAIKHFMLMGSEKLKSFYYFQK